MASAGGSSQEMEPAVDFAVRAAPPLHAGARTAQSSARSALSCHPPEKRLRLRDQRWCCDAKAAATAGEVSGVLDPAQPRRVPLCVRLVDRGRCRL
jgi:hypothetical protein